MRRIARKPWEFLAVFLVVFFLASVVLFALDFFPEPVLPETGSAKLAEQTQNNAEQSAVQFSMEVPTRVVIASIGVDTPIKNPTSTDVAILDETLLRGAVRYPESGLLGENARMLLFGHQSYLPVVHNQAFKAFNGLQKLSGGEEIAVYSETAVYHYRVTLVEHKSSDDALIKLGSGARTLTLTTCDSFGKKTDRYVVTAEFVSRESIAQTNHS